jgi:hypothetical protein
MAAISAVKICNMALSHVGSQSSIESLDEDSPAANACKQWYDWSRIQSLEAHNWNFARKRKVLAVITADPYDNWAWQYEFPSDCIVAREIVNPLGNDADAVPFEVTTTDSGDLSCILTDVAEAALVYTFDMTNPARYSPGFVKVLSWYIASNIEFTITGKRTIGEQVLAVIVGKATADNANEGIARAPREAEWIRGRS